MSDKETAKADEAAAEPAAPVQDANSAAVSAWRHPIEGPPAPAEEPAQAPARTPARTVPRRSTEADKPE